MMKASDSAATLPSNWQTILPVNRWEEVHFRPAVCAQPVESPAFLRAGPRTIAEAHVSECEVARRRRSLSSHRITRPRAGVRFHTTMKPLPDFR